MPSHLQLPSTPVNSLDIPLLYRLVLTCQGTLRALQVSQGTKMGQLICLFSLLPPFLLVLASAFLVHTVHETRGDHRPSTPI